MSSAAEPAARTILCVDDDTLMLRSLREQLLRGLGPGHEVALASSGAEALQLLDAFAREDVDVPLIVCDHIMPGMRGTELLVQLHAQRPQMVKILLTGQADIDAVGRAVNGANLYRLLTKPWQETDLVLTVREALRRVDHERELARHAAELALSHRRLEQSVELLRATMDATLDGLLVLDHVGHPVQINRQLVDLWRVPAPLARAEAGPALLEHLRAHLVEPDALVLDPALAGTPPLVLETRDGRAIEYVSRVHQVPGEPPGLVGCFRDVTQRVRSAELIRHQAFHDRLSGLPNRYQFDEALAQAVARARRGGDRVSVLFVDLDHFKRINDSLGHDAGDELLKAVAQRLTGCVRQGDLIARWGGDEFTVLLPSVRHPDEAQAVAERILAALAEPILVGAQALQVSASIGMATFPDDGDDGQALLKRADVALYRVKADGRNGFQPFSDHPQAADQQLALETALRGAIERGELMLHYQPQVDASSGAITHVEALARWHHPDMGWIAPDVFIPIAEQTGLILEMGEWLLRSAFRQAAQWHAAGFTQLRIGVNLSAVQFDRGDPHASILRALAESGLPARAVEVEVTEAAALRRLDTTSATLQALLEAGVSVALDDFGTGYASLAYLRQLPCRTLKIDRSFIRGLRMGSKDAAIISALIALAHGLRLRVVAEGVETREVADLLQRLGCSAMQGFLFGRPCEAGEITALLQRQPLHIRPLSPLAPVTLQ